MTHSHLIWFVLFYFISFFVVDLFGLWYLCFHMMRAFCSKPSNYNFIIQHYIIFYEIETNDSPHSGLSKSVIWAWHPFGIFFFNTDFVGFRTCGLHDVFMIQRIQSVVLMGKILKQGWTNMEMEASVHIVLRTLSRLNVDPEIIKLFFFFYS